MSRELGFKTWGEIIAELRAELGTETTGYLQVAQEFEASYGRDALISRLQLNYDAPIDADHLDLHYLILSMEPPLIYTTNYDAAIETAAAGLGRQYIKIASLVDIVACPHNAKQIIKFHGDFSAPDNIVFTRGDYNRRMQMTHELDILFRAHLLGKGLLFMGYSFRDENIDSIFQRHAELYETRLLPMSYLIAFDKDDDKERKLLEQNIKTIHLDSAEELKETISAINEKVIMRNGARQMDLLTQSVPIIALLASDLKNLEKYIADPNNSAAEKAERVRFTIQLRRMTKKVEEDLVNFLSSLMSDDKTPSEILEAIVMSYHHLEFSETMNIFNLSYRMIDLTAIDSLNREGDQAVLFDVLSQIEARFKPAATCYMLFLYLIEAREKNKHLTKNQLVRIFNKLRDCDHDKLDFSKIEGLSDQDRQDILSYYTSQDRDLAHLFTRSSFIPRRTLSQIHEQIMSAMPEALKKMT